MEIAIRVVSGKPANLGRSAGIGCLAAAWMLAATAGLAQSSSGTDQRTGFSHPDQAPITLPADTTAPASAPVKPSAAVPMPGATIPASADTVYGPYVPYHAPGSAAQNTAPVAATPVDPDANIVTEATAGPDERRLLTASNPSNDVDAGVVTYVASRPGEIPVGALVKVRLREDISTLTTQPGTRFTAEVSEPLMRNGQVIVPVGSVMEGRVTWIRGGKRIGGPAAIHLEPESITLPDGTDYMLRAQAIDTDRWDAMKVDNEGTIERIDHPKRTAAITALSAGSGMAAGAMMAGVPGALIGAGVGAGVSTVMWLKEDRQAELKKNLEIVFSLTEPMNVTPVRAATIKSEMPGGN